MHSGHPLAFGTLLRRASRAAGLTQEDLAERARVSVRTVSDLERAVNHAPHTDTVVLLAAALGLDDRERAAFVAAAERLRVPAPLAPPGRALAASARVPAPLVGRQRELARLEGHLAGHGPPVFLLAGEPGIGKSRVLQAAILRAVAQGWRVLDGGCQRQGGQEPYAPLLDAVQRHLRSQSVTALRAQLQGCAWLVRLLPELAAGPIEPLPPWTVPPAQERRLLVEAAQRFLGNIAGPAGTLLVLDDLQWAGPDALELLAALLRSPSPAHRERGLEGEVRVLGAYRDTEVQPQEPLGVWLADLAHREVAAHQRLGPLSPAEAATLVEELLPDADAALRARVLERAGGVPFFVVSCAQGLRQRDLDGGPDTLPWAVEQSIRQRLAALPAGAAQVLAAAAVVGREVPQALLVAATGLETSQVLDACAAACRARLLEEQGAEGYRFAHDAIREVLEADLGAGRRALVHGRVAATLEQAPGEPPVALLAYHYARGGEQEKALHYLERAGDQTRAQAALEAAAEYYQDLVARLVPLQRAADAARAREKLGTVLFTRGQYAAALPHLQQAAESFLLQGEWERAGRVAAQIGETYILSGAPREALRSLQPFLEALSAHGPSRGLAWLCGVVPRILFVTGRYEEQQVAADRAAELARTVQDDWLLGEAAWQQGLGLLAVGRVEEGRRATEEAVRLTAATGNLDILGRTLTMLASLACAEGDLAGAWSSAERALRAAEQMSNPRLIAGSRTKWGDIAFVAGRWDDARAHYEQALALTSQLDLSWSTAWIFVGLGRLAHGAGVGDEARQALEHALTLAERASNLHALLAAHALLAEGEVQDGQGAAARARLAPLLDRPGLWPQEMIAVQTTLAWARLELGEAGAAEALAAQAATRARAARDRVQLTDVLRVQALVLARCGRWVEAEQALEEGVALTRSIGYPYGEGRLLQVYGQLLTARREAQPARERLEAALALFRRLGARTLHERTEAVLATLG